MNLITNASESLGEGEGVIAVTLTQVRMGPGSSVPAHSQSDYVRLEVRDTGCGMTEQIQAKMFDPFFTTKFAGRGLGLAAVQGIVRDHGGTIHGMSTLGKVWCFEVLLPCASEAAQASSALAPTPRSKTSFTGTVLLVEDADALRGVVCSILRKHGITVIEAHDGRRAIDF